MAGAEDAVESVSDVVAGLRNHRRQLLPQLELLLDDHHAAEIFQGRVSFRHRTGQPRRHHRYHHIVIDLHHHSRNS